MALIPCPECGRMVSSDAEACPNCAYPVKGMDNHSVDNQKHSEDNSRNQKETCNVHQSPMTEPKRGKKRKWVVFLCVGLGILSICTIFYFILFNNRVDASSREKNVNAEILEDERVCTDEFPNREAIKKIIRSYCTSCSNNDFSELNGLYAPYVERYHSAYGKSREWVMDDHRKYDSTFKVYGKYSSIRWETFRIEANSKDRVEVVVVEDYTIDRVDNTKYSIFVLEKHFVINNQYQIVSVWDNQISKKKKDESF